MPTRAPQHRPAAWRPPVTKIADPYYSSKEWRTLRKQRLAIDGHKCVVAGCGKPAAVVDHIVRRRAGGADSLGNLRSLCRLHDNQLKEKSDGIRKSDGVVGNDMAKWMVPGRGGGRLSRAFGKRADRG